MLSNNTNWKKTVTMFIAGQSISLFGSSLVMYVIIWYITIETASGTMMTIATLCGFLPQIVIGVFAGVWADRFNRKKMIIIADAGIAIATLAVSILFIMNIREIWLLFIVLAFRSFGGGVQMPAISALIPQLVPKDKLMRVNGISNSIQAATLLISPAAGAMMLSYAAIEWTMLIDVATALIGILLLLTISVPVLDRTDRKVKKYLVELKEGIAFIYKNKLILGIILIYGVFFLSVTPAAMLTPLLVVRSYGPEVWRLTLNEIAFSAGSIIGGVIIASWGGFKNRLITLCAGISIIGGLNILLGMKLNFVLYLIIIGALGIIVPMISTPTTVIMQERIDKEMHGRVFGFFNIVTHSAFPIGMLLFGPLADFMEIETQLIITGVFISILGIVLLLNKKFISKGNPIE